MLPFANSFKFVVNVDIHSDATRQRDKIHIIYCCTKVNQMTLLHLGKIQCQENEKSGERI